MKAVARAKMVRTSPRKMALVAALIRRKTVAEARIILANTDKAAAEIVGKVLDAAIANAENNLSLKRADLVVETVLVGAGATLKRIRPRSRGQANRIMKRTSHLTIILSDQKDKPALKAPTEKTDVASEIKAETAPKAAAKPKTAAKATKEKK